ncbi:Myelin protein zero-like protein 2 Epithelial V-like antigen 1 Precursor [Larimichthys crocea]|uniref:Myelin protein zero-like protein 2 Epithelial V-like antigen 1 n=1 Tax=Larimichthys crocea TaxID=215358 RepID=A0A6G0I9K1_LARCR|nr:Myelin protein zero-like protein 2 Epithelial V-like antigen 1 Precursor [Larimichthys crocea]
MFVPMCRIWLLLLLGGFVVPGVRHVSAIEIYTAADVEAVNGTSVKLKCTFSSSQPVSLQSVTVSWNFRPLSGGTDESVFFYQGVPYPPQAGRFKGHAVWSGDILRRDVSISLHEVKPTFNGTFTCEVRNPPDVQGSNGEIVFRVVDKVSLSEIGILAAAVGGACAIILVLLCIFVAVRYYRKKQKENDFEANYRAEEWKDPTVCSPEEAVHLTVVTSKKEADSSDDEESEPSSGDDDEEEGGEEDDDDDDDDDDD